MNLAVGNSNPAGFSATSVQTQSTQLGDSPDSDAMFSGLAVGPLSASSKNTSEDVPDEKGGAEAVDSSAQGVGRCWHMLAHSFLPTSIPRLEMHFKSCHLMKRSMASSCVGLCCSGPLPEDLFSGLEDLSATVGTPATLVQSGSASPMLPEGLSPQRQPPQPSPAALASSPALLRQVCAVPESLTKTDTVMQKPRSASAEAVMGVSADGGYTSQTL